MRKAKVLLDFTRFSVLEKLGFYRNVITKLTGNATFANPEVSIEIATTMVDELEAAYLLATDGAHTLVSAMRDKVKLTDETFRKLAKYVDRTAEGNETSILSSGFHVSKQPDAAHKPELSAKNGMVSGSVKLVSRAMEGAKAYIWQFTKDELPENDDAWIIGGYSTKAKFEIEELTVANKYWFRVAGITIAGTTDYCGAVMKVVE